MGDYEVKGKVVTAVVRIGKDKTHYSLEVMDGSAVLGKREMKYTDYFTVSGVFLSYKFKKALEQVVEEA